MLKNIELEYNHRLEKKYLYKYFLTFVFLCVSISLIYPLNLYLKTSFFICGSLLVVYVVFSLYDIQRMKKWKSIEIDIIEKKILYRNIISRFRAEKYIPYIKYKFIFDGHEYVSSSIAYDDECISQEIILSYPYERENNPPPYELLDNITKLDTAFVNPNKPTESFLITSISNSRKNYLILMFLSGIILLYLA